MRLLGWNPLSAAAPIQRAEIALQYLGIDALVLTCTQQKLKDS